MELYWKRNLYILWLGLFFNHLAYTLSVPFFPIFLENDLGIQRGLEAWSGVSISISFLISGLCAPYWGSLADKYGKKLMLIRSGIGLGAAHLANYFVYDPYMFILVRIFQGLMAGFSPASIALVGTNTPEKHVGYALGVISTATAAGGILGPLAGGMLIHWVGLRECFIASGLITLGSAFIILLGVKEVHVRPTGPRSSVLQDLKQAAGNPRLMRIYGLILLVSTSVTILEPLLTIYVVQIGSSASSAALTSGIVFSAVGVATVIMGPQWGRIGGRIGYDKTLFIGLLGGGIGNLLSSPCRLRHPPFQLRTVFCGRFSGFECTHHSICKHRIPRPGCQLEPNVASVRHSGRSASWRCSRWMAGHSICLSSYRPHAARSRMDHKIDGL